MSVAELSALDIGALAADDSVLLCWATFPLLPDALETVKSWGFTDLLPLSALDFG
jgi:N6-adenosine-specific RNA methylase IME4